VVDLLRGHRASGRRFTPTDFIEEGPRIDGRAVLLEDCRDRDDALAKLAS
jgi:hypothetical protein